MKAGVEHTFQFPQHHPTTALQMKYLLLLAFTIAGIAAYAAPPPATETDRAFAKCLRDGALARRYGNEVEDATSLIREKCMPEFAA